MKTLQTDHFAIIQRGGLVLVGAMSAVAFSRLGEMSQRLTLIVSALALFIFGLWLMFQPQGEGKNPVAAAILTLIVMGVILGL